MNKETYNFDDILTNISSFLCVIEDYNQSIITEDSVVLALNILRASLDDFNKNVSKNETTTEEKLEQQST